MARERTEVVVTTRNTTSLTLGIISIVFGALALLPAWIPFLGILAVPVALIGGVFGLLGIGIAVLHRFRGAGLPVLGLGICVGAVFLIAASTGKATLHLAEAASDTSQTGHRRANPSREGSAPSSRTSPTPVVDHPSETSRSDPEFSVESASQAIAADSPASEIGADSPLPETEADSPPTESSEEAEARAKAEYIGNALELYDLNAQYMNSFGDGTVPGVLFKIRNRGDRSLDQVEVTVYFKDAEGTIISEDSYHPVLVNDFGIGNSTPLKPSYIWQMEKGKFYSAKSVPSEWHEGSVEAAITDIEFTEPE